MVSETSIHVFPVISLNASHSICLPLSSGEIELMINDQSISKKINFKTEPIEFETNEGTEDKMYVLEGRYEKRF